MAVLVDTNVILDLVHDDPKWADWADAQVTRFQTEGLIVNPVIYAELCTGAEAVSEVDEVLTSLKMGYREISRPALYLAAKAYRKYRQRGGAKTAPLPDFFIGAQAEDMGIPLLTRDKARYTTYFPSVRLISPPAGI